MSRIREVGTLWIGGRLSWMEQLCLKSFVNAGQRITLFSYEDIPNVPEGVICRDGREILDTDDFIKYEKKNSYALFADLFRLHMIHKNPGMIWIDTDVYCHRPMDYDSDYVFGYELPDSNRVNNAILGLPSDSPVLKAMLEFTADRFSVAAFLPDKLRKEYRKAAKAGNPVHVSQQPWGVWGPLMVTHFVHEFGLQDLVQPLDAFYPVTFRERKLFMRRTSMADGRISERTTALHYWASNKRELGKMHNGLPPAGSWFERALRDQAINPALAPIAGRNSSSFDTGLFDELADTKVEKFADIGGTARSLALSLHARDDCDLLLVDIDPQGQFPAQPSSWVAEYTDFLIANGVDASRIRVAAARGDLHPCDAVVSLNYFGDSAKIKHLTPSLGSLLHADSTMFLDIRKGTGTFPALRKIGQVETLRKEGDLCRVRFNPDPPAPDMGEDWADIARGLAGKDGFFSDGPEGHSFLFVPRSKKVLVVTFDNLDIAMNKRDSRRPWGYSFIEKQGWSMLGVLAGGWTWYRNPWVSAEFDRLKAEGFFQQFDRVVFYGASMGGYAAAAFSAACPGADVVAISPQSTLDKSLVPFESRYKSAWERDFSGPYGDAAQASHAAGRVMILYDPYEPLDARHVDRFTGPNVLALRCPLMGHRLGSSLSQMGLLTDTILAALSGQLDTVSFYKSLRARHHFPRYQRELFKRALQMGRPELARKVGNWVLARGDNRAIRLAMPQIAAPTPDQGKKSA